MIKIGDYYNLKLNNKTILSKKKDNGYSDQYFAREEVKWVVLDIDERNNEMLLISEEPLKQEITFAGKNDENIMETLDKYCAELHRICKEITGIDEARSLTVEDIIKTKYWENKTKQDILFKENSHWLASRYVNPYSSDNCCFGLQYLDSYGVGNYSMSDYDYNNRVRPVVITKMN